MTGITPQGWGVVPHSLCDWWGRGGCLRPAYERPLSPKRCSWRRLRAGPQGSVVRELERTAAPEEGKLFHYHAEPVLPHCLFQNRNWLHLCISKRHITMCFPKQESLGLSPCRFEHFPPRFKESGINFSDRAQGHCPSFSTHCDMGQGERFSQHRGLRAHRAG